MSGETFIPTAKSNLVRKHLKFSRETLVFGCSWLDSKTTPTPQPMHGICSRPQGESKGGGNWRKTFQDLRDLHTTRRTPPCGFPKIGPFLSVFRVEVREGTTGFEVRIILAPVPSSKVVRVEKSDRVGLAGHKGSGSLSSPPPSFPLLSLFSPPFIGPSLSLISHFPSIKATHVALPFCSRFSGIFPLNVKLTILPTTSIVNNFSVITPFHERFGPTCSWDRALFKNMNCDLKRSTDFK